MWHLRGTFDTLPTANRLSAGSARETREGFHHGTSRRLFHESVTMEQVYYWVLDAPNRAGREIVALLMTVYFANRFRFLGVALVCSMSAGAADEALAPNVQYGASPPLPPPQKSVIPTVDIAPARLRYGVYDFRW